MSRLQQLIDHFATTYGHGAVFAARAPGRVNLIGEHTDYNDGFCLPMAIERDVLVVGRARDDRTLAACSLEQEGVASTDLSALGKQPDAPWFDYVQGCAEVLLASGIELPGVDLAITGNVPLGSGLSSSAALEVAVIHALLQAAGRELDGTAIATLAQKAENGFVGTQCGILDQLSSSCGVAGSALLMDCRSLELAEVPLPEGVSIVIADTGKRRGLVDSAYNERRAQCEAGAQALGVSHLRDVTLHGLRTAVEAGELDDLARRRCAYVVAENGRTQAAAACLRAGDAEALGQLMDQSHAGLQADFEVTCEELDHMTAIARSLPGCLGSRMTGAGFGGCTVSLVRAAQAGAFAKELEQRYLQRFDLPAAVYVTGAAPGAGAIGL